MTSLATNSTNLTDHPWLESISGIEATGNLELVVQLTKPSPPFAERFSQYLLGLAAPVGTGPYRLHQERSSETVLERFDSFYSGRPAVDRVLLRPYATMRTAWVGLLRSTVDMVTDVPANAVEFLSRDEVQIVSFPRRYQIMVAFNSAWGPFRSPVVRRALNAAVNRDVLIEKVLQGAGTPATGPLWPQNWAYDRSIPPFRFDTAGAEALLDQAGLRRPLVAGTERPPARFRFTCLLPGGLAVLERIALELQKQLYDIGVDVQFESVSTEEFERRINASEFEAVLIDLISGPTAARPFIFWRSRPSFEGMNVFGYENSEVEALFESLRVARNEAAIRSTTSRLQRAFIQDPPALAIAWNERARVIRRTFRIPEDPGRDPLLSLAQWTPVAAFDR